MYITVSMDTINIYTKIINCLILCLAPPNINFWLRYCYCWRLSWRMQWDCWLNTSAYLQLNNIPEIVFTALLSILIFLYFNHTREYLCCFFLCLFSQTPPVYSFFSFFYTSFYLLSQKIIWKIQSLDYTFLCF